MDSGRRERGMRDNAEGSKKSRFSEINSRNSLLRDEESQTWFLKLKKGERSMGERGELRVF